MISKIPTQYLIFAKPDSQIDVNAAKITAFVGVHPRPITLFHIVQNKYSFFHAGDSGYVPIKDYQTDVAFLPTGSPSPSCTAETALQFTLDLRPKISVAMHGNIKQMRKYKELAEEALPEIRVVIPTPYEPIKLTL